MTTRQREGYTAPVQLESLLEVPVKLILLEDLIREKAALAQPDSSDLKLVSRDRESVEEDDYRRAGGKTGKKCLFDCCATPSRWRDTDCYSNNSQFRTAGISLPWHDALAVIPVMQVENSNIIANSKEDTCTNEDTDTDVEMSNKNSDDEKCENKRSTPDTVTIQLPLSSPIKSPIISNNNNADKDNNVSKRSNSNPKTNQNEDSPSSKKTVEPSSPSPTTPVSSQSVTVVLGKVTEKPTRYQDYIITRGSNTSSSNNSCNTITPRKEQQNQQDVIGDADNTSQGSINSADDTLKLTFYNEGRKELTKEFRTRIESGGTSANDVHYFENQHGLQMSRVIRDISDEAGGSDGNTRMQQDQQTDPAEETEARSSSVICNDKNTQNSKNSNRNPNSNSVISSTISSNDGVSLSVTTASIITQPQQLRLTSSIIQNLNNHKNAKIGDNSVSNDNNGNSSIQQGRQSWEGLQISRCQKELNSGVIALDGESSNSSSVSNREITSESFLPTSISHNPQESEKGESENSIERHLQTYLTSLKYVKPTESGNEKSPGQEVETGSNKGKSPVTSPLSRNAPTSIISPVISPHISSPGGRYGPITATAKVSSIQRVSPSQQASSLDSWPERTIARIPTRPFLRRNSTYELQQQQQHQPITPRPPYHHHAIAQQQPHRMVSHTATVMGSPTTAAIAAIPLQSPPKRFKSANVPSVNAALPHYQQAQQHHQQQQYQQQSCNTPVNRYANVSNVATAPQHPIRNSSNIHPQQQQQQQHLSSNTGRIATIQQQQHYQAYNNLQHYNQRQPLQQNTMSAVSTITQRPRYSPSTAQVYNQQQQQQPQHHQYQMKHQTNSNAQSQHNQQQQLQFQRHLQESLLIASTAMASSSEPVDSSYNERLRRYCEFYQKQELDVSKLQEYYKKYGFYPWDVLCARDESIIRHMRSQEQQQLQQEQLINVEQADVREGQVANAAAYDLVSRMEVDNTTLQHHQHRQLSVRAMNVPNSPGRSVPNYSPSKQQIMTQPVQGGLPTGRTVNISPPILSPQALATASIQNRYQNHQNNQQLQQLHNQREYALHQQNRGNNRYYHPADRHDHQNYSHHEHQQQHGNVPTNYDIQNSPHFRNAYNQLAAAAAAVTGNAAAVSQNQMRSATDMRNSNNVANAARDARATHLFHSQSSMGNRPVVMTVSDPVPAPPDAVPLSIHRQALEQVIKHNQAVANISIGDTYTTADANRHANNTYNRRDQIRDSPPSPPSQIVHHQQILHQSSRHGQPYTLERVRNEDSIVGVKEPLKVVPSPTLAHQTSVIRRIQQHESPPNAMPPFVTGPNSSRYVSDRPGVSYRRISEGGNTDSNGNPSTAFLYQQHKDAANMHSSNQFQQQHHHHNSIMAQSSLSAGVASTRRNVVTENEQGIARGTHKRRIIITDNNGINQNHMERCSIGVVSSPIPLIAGEEEVITTANPAAVSTIINKELPEDDDDDREESVGGAGWQYDHVVLLDKRIKTYMCKRCFETLKTEQQIRNHLFCKMLANHVQCHVCLQLITSDTYPAHLQIHGMRPPDNIQLQLDN